MEANDIKVFDDAEIKIKEYLDQKGYKEMQIIFSAFKRHFMELKSNISKLEKYSGINGRFLEGFDMECSMIRDEFKIFFNNHLVSKQSTSDPKIIQEKIMEMEEKINKLNEDLKKIPLIEDLTNENKVTIVVGANGSGKSSLAQHLKDSILKNLYVVPAQKNMVLNPNTYAIQDGIRTTKDRYNSSWSNKNAKSIDKIDNDFILLIYAFVNEYNEFINKQHEKSTLATSDRDILVIDKESKENDPILILNNLYNNVLPDITFKPNISERLLEPQKKGIKYSITGLSDGERAVLYYVMLLQLAEENSYIVIDEPETYMHTSLAIKLWNTLLNYRSDCRFIFISHNIDFVQSLSGASIQWLKEYEYPNTFNFEEVKDLELPQDLILKIMGSKKDVLFIEGESHGSLDYQIYNALFGERYNIQPVGGHLNVKNYTKLFNSSMSMGNCAKGIMDRDSWTEEEIVAFRKSGIEIPEVNEAEMFLLADEVLTAVIDKVYGSDSAKMSTFKQTFYDTFKREKERCIMIHMKNLIDHNMENQKLDKNKSLDQLKVNLKQIMENIPIEEEYQKLDCTLTSYLKDKNYNGLLQLCNLKETMTKEVTGKTINRDYINIALYEIISNKNLQEKIKRNYFTGILK